MAQWAPQPWPCLCKNFKKLCHAWRGLTPASLLDSTQHHLCSAKVGSFAAADTFRVHAGSRRDSGWGRRKSGAVGVLAPTWKPYRPVSLILNNQAKNYFQETYLMPPNATPGSTPTGIDIFSFFGIICENSTWYITKYPNGYSYQVKVDETTNRIEYVAPDSTIDGKKSPLFHMYWWV